MAWRKELYFDFCAELPGIDDITQEQIRDFLDKRNTQAIESDLFYEALSENHLVNVRRLKTSVLEMLKERSRNEKEPVLKMIFEAEISAIEEFSKELLKDLH